MYVYIKSELQLWTVGFYNPNGEWHAESDHDTPAKAAERVHYLNGGNAPISNNVTEEVVSMLADDAISNMGDVFYDPDGFQDYNWGLNEGEEPDQNESANDRLMMHVKKHIEHAIRKALKYQNVSNNQQETHRKNIQDAEANADGFSSYEEMMEHYGATTTEDEPIRQY